MNGQTPVQVQYPLPGGGLAMYSPSGTLTDAHPDWLGSSRLVTSTTQTCIGDSAYAPFGEPYGAPVGIPCRGPATYDFTGQQQWAVTASAGNAAVDDFPFREYHPVQGRWITPDPAGRGAVDITNPQTWNRYAYLSNNPLNAVDPQGLYKQTLGDINIPLPTFCPGILGCGSSFGEGFFGGNSISGSNLFGSGGCDIDPNCNFDNSAAEIGYFYGGAFSGTWNQQTMNSYEAQQFWQQQPASSLDPAVAGPHPDDPNSKIQDSQFLTSLWGSLVQNQNPGGQAAYWAWQYEQGQPSPGQFTIRGAKLQFPKPFPSGMPDHYPFGPTKPSYSISQCISQNPNQITMCIQLPGLF